jgi:Uma2 family endonuclease
MVAAIHNLISEEEYLQTSYRPDCDFIDGLVVRRNWGQFPHARLQILLAVLLANNEKQWKILALPEQRLRVRKGRYRIPDVTALAPDYDRSRPVVEIAPLPCIQILSPEHTMPRILDRCWDYYDLGVPETWIFDPVEREVFIASDRRLVQFTNDILHCGKIEISCSALFAHLGQARMLSIPLTWRAGCISPSEALPND